MYLHPAGRWDPDSSLAATAEDQRKSPDTRRAGFVPADGHWNDDHYNGDAGHGMDSCGCFGCYVGKHEALDSCIL